VIILSFDNGRGGERRRKSDDSTDVQTSGKSRGQKKKAAAPEVGDALRSVYDRALNEDIPPEMLDLLGKLG
jgi:hypothetical protein